MRYITEPLTEARRESLFTKMLNEPHLNIYSSARALEYVQEYKEDVETFEGFRFAVLGINFVSDMLHHWSDKTISGEEDAWSYYALMAHYVYYSTLLESLHLEKEDELDFDDKVCLVDSLNMFESYSFFKLIDCDLAASALGEVIAHYFSDEVGQKHSSTYPEFINLCLLVDAFYRQDTSITESLKRWDLGVYGDVLRAAIKGDNNACAEQFLLACDTHLHLSYNPRSIGPKDKYGCIRVTWPDNQLGLFSPELLILMKILKEEFNITPEIEHPLLNVPHAKIPKMEKIPQDKVIEFTKKACFDLGYNIKELPSYNLSNELHDQFFD